MRSLTALLALALAACAAETSSPAVLDHLELVQAPVTGTPGRQLDSLILIRAVDGNGRTMPGIEITWSVASGGGVVVPVTTRTDQDGVVAARWTLGLADQAQVLNVSTPDLPALRIEVAATAFRAAHIAIGDGFGCGVDSLGDAWCWGALQYYVNVPGSIFGSRPVKVDSGHALVEIVAGGQHACARSATTTYCWGAAVETGRGPATPTSGLLPPGPVADGHQFVKLAASGLGRGTCGLDAAGQGWCWGVDLSGEFGSLATLHAAVSSPAPITQGGAVFTSLSLGYNHACALVADGTAYCWGGNTYRQLGDTANSSSTAFVPSLVTTDLRFAALNAGDGATCGVTAIGTSWCWGAAVFSGEFDPTPVPFAVPGNGFSPPALQWDRWAALRTGRVYFWGTFDINDYYLSAFRKPAPGEVDVSVSGVVELSLSYQTLCGRRADGVVLCWGDVPDADSPYGTRIAETASAVPAP